MRLRSLVAALVFVLATDHATADPVADFYKDKQLRFIIRANPGGNYDLYMRLLARHIGKYIPGNPATIPMNMPGGGGLTALNYFDKVAPHDGTVLTMLTQTVPMDQALDLDPNLKVDMRKLGWIGNMSDENMFLVLTQRAPTKSLDDAKRRDTVLAGTGAGGAEVSLLAIVNHALGTRFKIIHGYRSSPEMNLAMQRGEVEGRIMTNLRLAATFFPNGIADLNVILQTGLRKDSQFQDIPLLLDVGRDTEHKLMTDFMSNVMSLARPVATNSDVPKERVEALRRAFDAAMKDTALLDEARQQGLDISPWSGEQLEQTVNGIFDTPAPVLARIREVVKGAAGAGHQQR